MPNGTYGGVRGRRKSSLLDWYNRMIDKHMNKYFLGEFVYNKIEKNRPKE